jgi:hypothetical protein
VKDGLFSMTCSDTQQCVVKHCYLQRELTSLLLKTTISRPDPYDKETSSIAEEPVLRRALEEGDPAATISRFALEQQDPLSGQALDLFVRIYGAQAGNLALTCLSRGEIGWRNCS